MSYAKRTRTCGELRKEHAGETVTLNGWVDTIRDHGGVLFINLRDRYGKVQLVIDPEGDKDLYETARKAHYEDVVSATGEVRERDAVAINPDMPTGEIEVAVVSYDVLNAAKPLPFMVTGDEPVDEALGFKHRYLEMRRDKIKENIILRHKVVYFIRKFLIEKEGFVEVETPLLTCSTPEGARDFLVPSRHYPGTFYALPQSPQQYKELLMVGGIDKYFQIPRCLRDEDPRADRQVEHTQLDLEMSFVDRDDVLGVLERLLVTMVDELELKPLMQVPIPRFTFHEVMERWGSDKPDLRFGLELSDITDVFADTELKFIKGALDAGGVVKGLRVPGQAAYTRKQIGELEEVAKTYGAGGLLWFAWGPDEFRSSIKKFLSEDDIAKLKEASGAEDGDLLLAVAGGWEKTCNSIGQVRAKLGKDLGLIDDSKLGFAFVVDFPLFSWDEEGKRLDPVHHMFTRPLDEDAHLLDTEPLKVRSTQYDLIANGYELCSGSIRIHERELQTKIMKMIGLGDEEIEKKFGHLLSAFDYGAPPHGGVAPGIERILMVLAGTDAIRDVVAFPKTTTGRDLLMNAPSPVDEEQLAELGLALLKKPDEEKATGE